MQNALNLLIECRQRLLRVIFVFLSFFAVAFFYSESLLHWYLLPLQRLLSPQHHLIATNITTPIITPLTLALNIALFAICPYGIWQIWCFAAPALYQKEQRTLGGVLVSSLGLFCLGCLFCYFFILPLMFQCLVHALPKEILLLPDISSVTQFTTEMLIIFGCGFQIPLFFYLLIHNNVLSLEQCRAIRPYVIVAAFILGMLLTPPDVTAQILLALPLWGLFEIGIFFARVISKSIR